MAQVWNVNCNKQAYGLTTGSTDNLQKVEFKSGRAIRYLRNSITKHEHSIKFKFDDSRNDPKKIINGKTEFQWFIYWLDVTLKGCTEPFFFTDLISRKGEKQYILKDYPTISGQKWKYISCTFVEV